MTEQKGPLSWLTEKFTDQTKSLYIARPDALLSELIYKHPDVSIPRGAKLTVRASECALFFREGKCIGRIDPGSVLLDTANIPFLGHLFVDKLTGGNHFLCELFFVSTNETILRVPKSGGSMALGQYRDLNSANVVDIHGTLSYTVKVQDPIQLVVGLTGQSSWASQEVERVLAGRLLNLLRQVVGRRVHSNPVLDVVSNVDVEDMSSELRKAIGPEFAELGLGVGRMFNLVLSLDQDSVNLLRVFGQRQSELVLAKDENFVQANLIKGQLAAMEGLGHGLAAGKGPMILSGNIGAAFHTGPGSRAPAPRSSAGPGAAVLSTRTSFLIVGDAGVSGPYSARQLALMILSRGQSPDQVNIRYTDDLTTTFAADLEPTIVAEFQRRAPKPRASPRPEATPPDSAGSAGRSEQRGDPGATALAAQALDAALLAFAVDGVLAEPSIAVLARMAVGGGLAANEAAGRAVILAAAARLGVRAGE